MAGYFTPYFTNYFGGVQGGHGSSAIFVPLEPKEEPEVLVASEVIEEKLVIPDFRGIGEELREVFAEKEAAHQRHVSQVLSAFAESQREKERQNLLAEEREAAEAVIYLMNLGPERIKVSDEEAAEALMVMLMRTLH